MSCCPDCGEGHMDTAKINWNPLIIAAQELQTATSPDDGALAYRHLHAAQRQLLNELGVSNRTGFPVYEEGDRAVTALGPDAYLVIDASGCIVLATPMQRITISSVDAWREGLDNARTFAKIYDADVAIRDNPEAAEEHNQHAQEIENEETQE